MSLKFSRFGPFVGCSEYPTCGWTTRPREPGAEESDGSAPDKLVLGELSDGVLPDDAATGMRYAGLEVSVRDGPVGWYVQLGGNVTHEQLQSLGRAKPPPDIRALKITQLRAELEARLMDSKGKKGELVRRLLHAHDLRQLVPHRRVSLPEGTKPTELTISQAELLISLPRVLGRHLARDVPIMLHSGRFGPYVTMPAPPADEIAVSAGDVASAKEKEENKEEKRARARAADGETSNGEEEEEEEEEEEVMVMCSLPKRVSIWEVTVDVAADLLEAKMARDAARRKRGGGAGGGGGGRAATTKAKKKSSAAAPKKKRKKKPAPAQARGKKTAAGGEASELKRPLNAYMLFSSDQRAAIKAANPTAGLGEVAKMIGDKWKTLSEDEKAPYTRQAEALKAEYVAAKEKLLAA